MSVIHPDTSQYKFRFEPFLRQEYAFALDPDRPVCPDYNARVGPTSCPRGTQCPFKHVLPVFYNKIVCKHWLRGLCKKNDQCEYLHEYNLRKMPECVFFAKNGYCTQAPECQYLHVDPQARIPPCGDFAAGFCPSGSSCSKRHIARAPHSICRRYLSGFCPLGARACPHVHVRLPSDLLTELVVQPPRGLKYAHPQHRLWIRKDEEINTRKRDEENERRLNAIINGEMEA